jgi:hypothetical protein
VGKTWLSRRLVPLGSLPGVLLAGLLAWRLLLLVALRALPAVVLSVWRVAVALLPVVATAVVLTLFVPPFAGVIALLAWRHPFAAATAVLGSFEIPAALVVLIRMVVTATAIALAMVVGSVLELVVMGRVAVLAVVDVHVGVHHAWKRVKIRI